MINKVKYCRGIDLGVETRLLLIAGPCVLQSEDTVLRIAEKVKKISIKNSVNLIFKSSFDKANRTSGTSDRGPGIDEGLHILRRVAETLDLPILTDVHDPQQVPIVAEVADVLQIPAFLCRQTSLLEAAGSSGRSVNIKKGQFMAPEDMMYAVQKVQSHSGASVTLTERGSSFGYRDLVVDYRSLSIMRQFAPVIFDGTHSVQSPGSSSGRTGGNREMVPILVRAALAVGVDGLFLEVHDDPDSSPSDAANMITPDTLDKYLPFWLEMHMRVLDAGF